MAARRRLAADGVPHAGPAAVLRRHLLPARRPVRAARLPEAARGARTRPGASDRGEVDRAGRASSSDGLGELATHGLGAAVTPVPERRGAARAAQLRGASTRRTAASAARPSSRNPMDLALLLRAWRRTGDARARDAVRATRSSGWRAGGIYDQLGGGFHRYSVDERWLVPHFEKMLYDNALLAPPVRRGAADRAGARCRRRWCAETARVRAGREMTDAGGRLLRHAGRRQRGRGGEVLRLDARRSWRRCWRRRTVAAAAMRIQRDREGNFEHGSSVLERRCRWRSSPGSGG